MSKVAINIKEKYTDTDHYQKHFTLEDRIKIQKIISENRDEFGKLKILLKDIGKMLQNDPSTISKEVKLHRIFKNRTSSTQYGIYNSLCTNFKTCTIRNGDIYKAKAYKKNCTKCIDSCKEFKKIICPHLMKFPWVCNGCPKASSCYLEKFYYYSDEAQHDYKLNLVETRQGINLTENEFKELNHTLTSLIKDKGQPIAHIVHSNNLPVSERTIYNYVEKGYLSVKNIDLRRKVTYKKRKTSKESQTVIKARKIGRMYDDYKNFIEMNPDVSVVQVDTVEGIQSENGYLLTLHFVKYKFQLAYYIHEQDSESVINIFNQLYNTLGSETFQKMFQVVLVDNGKEFSDPIALEIAPDTGEPRTKVFYCDPLASCQKGSCEKNHEYIRYLIPQGTSLLNLPQEKIYLMMSHINSTIRPSNRACPYDFMALEYGTEVLDLLKIKKIDSKLVTLCPKLIK